ncbi:MAG TPA: HD-GYP domain-containing protein [Candidatus Acidoferrum sp.]|nr:HD-GYP domain-containing protein [Candidatus Acidoferrum sp.]
MNPTNLRLDLASAERENWRAFLKNQNYDVIATDTAKLARQMCLRLEPYFALFFDHLIRVLSADLHRRKQDLLSQRTPVVLVSSNPAELVEERQAGAADFSGTPCVRGDGLGRIAFLLRLEFGDEPATTAMLSLARSVEARHSRADGHSDRLAQHAMRLGESLGLSEDDLQELRLGCLLHDIGKVDVPDKILLKPGRLNSEEIEIVRQHPVTGEKICALLKCLGPILPLIRHHHERMDGSGYPDRLCGEEIPLKARILQVADVYDALTSDRPYRDALSSEEALGILHEEAMHGWLDASLVWRFSRGCQSDDYFSVRRHSTPASYHGYLNACHAGRRIAKA